MPILALFLQNKIVAQRIQKADDSEKKTTKEKLNLTKLWVDFMAYFQTIHTPINSIDADEVKACKHTLGLKCVSLFLIAPEPERVNTQHTAAVELIGFG